MFYVYVLHSITDHGLYIGYSTDLKRRLSEHKQGASAATKYRGPWKLIYYEAYIERADAVGRERYLKSGSGRRSCGRSCDIISKIFRRVRPKAFYAGYPAWTRTKNNASKGRCVTITPRGIWNFRLPIADQARSTITFVERKSQIAICKIKQACYSPAGFGRRISTVVPFSGTLVIAILPPCASTTACAMAKLNPAPADPAFASNGLNNFGKSSG